MIAARERLMEAALVIGNMSDHAARLQVILAVYDQAKERRISWPRSHVRP